ncbi:hypothetical protein EV368DRAFT_87806 [Lentinula lateritia]|nr:hypothetical protein EV368DRAFT_87806 [Lentinula lateritia]
MVRFLTTLAGYSAFLVASGCIALPFISGTNEGQAIPALTPVSNMISPSERSQDLRNMEGFDLGLSSSILRRTVATQCVPLESEMLKKLGGWDEMNKFADTHWSKKGRNVVTNDKHEPDDKAELCTAGPVQISYEGTPDCITNNASTAGVFDGTTGTVSMAVLQGFSATSMFTISSSTILGLTSSFMTMLNFPDITGLMSQFSASATISNTATKSFTITQNEMVTSTILMAAPNGESCDATLSVRTCTIQGKGTLPLTVTNASVIWFEYKDKVKGHYKCKYAATSSSPGMLIHHSRYIDRYEAGQLKASDRSGYINFSGPIQVKTHSAYAGSCQNISLTA